MPNNKTTSQKPNRPKVPFKAARPSLMQGWGKIKELSKLKELLYKDYKINRTIDKILVDELAYYIWEINALMNAKWEISRADYANDVARIYLNTYAPERLEELQDSIKADIIKRHPGMSKDIAEMHNVSGISSEVFALTEVRKNMKLLETVDILLSASERRRDALLKEIDRREMARILIDERRNRGQ